MSMRRIILCSTLTAFAVLSGAVVWNIADITGVRKHRLLQQPVQTQQPQQISPAANQEIPERYIVIAEGDYINLYRIGNRRALEKSERIDIMLFPKTDRDKLTEGVEFESRSGACEYMESFIG